MQRLPTGDFALETDLEGIVISIRKLATDYAI
jgi:hypothetical protein